MALEFDGKAAQAFGSNAKFRLQLFDLSSAPKTIAPTSILYYSLFPEDSGARNVAIDLHFTDGTWMSDGKSRSESHKKIECADQNGRSVTASGHHGGKNGMIPLNAWSTISINLGILAGKSIDAIWFLYDHPGNNSDYSGMLDDLRITN